MLNEKSIEDLYNDMKKLEAYEFVLLIEYLVFERKVIKWIDDHTAIDYYLQPRFQKAMEQYLTEYEAKRNHKAV